MLCGGPGWEPPLCEPRDGRGVGAPRNPEIAANRSNQSDGSPPPPALGPVLPQGSYEPCSRGNLKEGNSSRGTLPWTEAGPKAGRRICAPISLMTLALLRARHAYEGSLQRRARGEAESGLAQPVQGVRYNAVRARLTCLDRTPKSV